MTTFSIYWNVTEVDHVRDYATRRNIKKPVLFPRYQGNVGDFETVLAYVGSKEVAPTSNLSVIHSEDSLSENSRSAFSGEVIWTGVTGYTSASYFLLTDVVGDYVSSKPEPFYWKHVLPSADVDPDSVAILDMNLEEVDTNSYYAERVEARNSSDVIVSGSYESCSVYSNYTNSYSEETGDVELYFVRYTASGTAHYQILNPTPAFSAAGLDDVSTVTGQLKPWRKVYIKTTGPSLYTITTPGLTSSYYLKPLERSRILVRDPIDRADDTPWFVNISNGAFTRIVGSTPYTYSIPEFSSQTFSPLYPYKVEVEEQAEYLRSDILKVDRTPMKVDDDLYSMDILIRNAQGEVLYALTTDTSKGGTFYEEGGERKYRTLETDNAWITWDANGISGWDAEDGFIHLQREYPDTRYFYVTYYYEETGYEYTSLNVNPIFDEGYNGQFYVLYVVPDGGLNGTVTTAIHYLKVDRSGRVVEASGAPNVNVGDQYMYYTIAASTTGSGINLAGQTYIEVTDYTDFPDAGIVVFTDTANTARYLPYESKSSNRLYFESGYTIPANVPDLAPVRLHSFQTPYSTSSSSNSYQWLVLAEVHAAATSRVDELSIIDLRMPGGVVKDKYKDQALAIDPRAIWARPEVIASRGQQIPGDSVAVVKVPYTLLKEYGGSFTREQVEAIVTERHLAAGVVPVVIFDGAIPYISSIVSTTDAITVCWDSEGSTYHYNIYYSSMPSGPWTLVNSSPIEDQVYGNCYTISGLTSGLIYYVTIAAVDTNNIEGPKGTPWGIRVRTS